MPAWSSTSKAPATRSRSLSEPTMMRMSLLAMSGGPFVGDDGVVLAAARRAESGIHNVAPHLVNRGPVGGAGRGHHVLLDHQPPEIVAPEPRGPLPDFEPHAPPRRLEVGDVTQHPPRGRSGPQVGDRVGLGRPLHLG